jgi:dihydrofolate reductase
MKNISIIVAVAQNNAIGKDNRLLWHISDDMKRFKKITVGHTVIMGKNTYNSLPNRPLKDRVNIVISDNQADRFDGCEMAFSIEEAISKCRDYNECFIIGGASVYRQFFPYASTIYLTKVHKEFEADTFFPEIKPEEWFEVSREDVKDVQNDFSYSYIILKRKN